MSPTLNILLVSPCQPSLKAVTSTLTISPFFKIYILYLVQRNDCKFFSIAKDIDPKYASELSKAVKNKLKILCYDCKFSSKGIKLNNQISFINDDQ